MEDMVEIEGIEVTEGIETEREVMEGTETERETETETGIAVWIAKRGRNQSPNLTLPGRLQVVVRR